jgi:hypothetical protein
MKEINRYRLRYRMDPRIDKGNLDSSYRRDRWKKFDILCLNCRHLIRSIKDLKIQKWKNVEGSSIYLMVEYHCPECGWLIFKDRIFYKKEEYIR